MSKSVEEIIKDYLKDNGYSGLYYESECGCEIDNLALCEGYIGDCTPGYKVECGKCKKPNIGECPYCCNEFDFAIVSSPCFVPKDENEEEEEADENTNEW